MRIAALALLVRVIVRAVKTRIAQPVPRRARRILVSGHLKPVAEEKIVAGAEAVVKVVLLVVSLAPE
jgi:hypothetical protein